MVTLKTFHPSWTIYQKKRPDVDSLDLRAVEIQQISGGGGGGYDIYRRDSIYLGPPLILPSLLSFRATHV